MSVKMRAAAVFAVLSFTLLGYAIYWNALHPSPEPFAPRSTSPVLIAHAGGGIDGHVYTNSLEAVERSLAEGFTFIELDLSLTADGVIVAAHDWEEFSQMAGVPLNPSSILLNDIKSASLYGRYTPLSADRIRSLFAGRDAWLVTDKIKDLDALLAQIPLPRDRMFVEVFSYKAYVQALKKGIRYPMLCIWDKEALNKYWWLLRLGKVKMITAPVELVESAAAELEELHGQGVAIFAFTSNDAEFIKKHINKRVTGFYTDTVKPEDLE